MLEEAADKLECGQTHGLIGSGLGVCITEAHIAFLKLEDTGICNRCTEDIGCEIANAAGGRVYGLGVNVPILLPEILGEL